MLSTVTTRRMKAEKQAEELKQAQLLADRLLAERNENEVELRLLRAKQTSLTTSLTQLRSLYDEAQNDLDQQQRKIDSFSEFHAQHEAALDRIKLLDQQLREAHAQLATHRTEQELQLLHGVTLREEMQASSHEIPHSTHIQLSSGLSHAVKRGEPTAAQRYLDSLLDEAAAGLGEPGTPGAAAHAGVNLGQLIYHCMRKWPQSTRLINGVSGVSFTNEEMLRHAVPVARALAARGASGSVAVVVMRNHEQLVAVYYGALFAGVTLCMLEPASTESELRHFMALAQPRLVFSDADRRATAQAAAGAAGGEAELVAGDELAAFVEGHSQSLDDFVVAGVAPAAAAPAVLLPTSGSTGLPKAALISHEGLIAQLPTLWSHDGQFPRPTARAMFLSTAQWMTHTDLLTSCPVFDIACLTAPRSDPETALHMIHTYKPTFFLAAPGLTQAVVSLGAPAQLASLRTLLVTGGPPAPSTLTAWKEKLPAGARVWNGYGMTEAQGFVTLPDPDTPLTSVGKVINIFDYKFIDDEGKEVSPSEGGELILSSSCIIKAYLGEEGAAAHRASLAPGGWWRTGDVLRQDDRGHLHYRERKKFWFKHNNYQISPEEVETAVLSVAGVAACAVSGSPRGAAAAVQLQPGARVSRAQIHAAVDASLLEHKRLHGGIAFVTELPHTHSGKLHRRECAALLAELLASGQCC